MKAGKKVKAPAIYELGRVVMFDNPIKIVYDTTKLNGAMGLMGWTDTSFITITLGDANNWETMVEYALHELMELAFRFVRGAYEPIFTSVGCSTSGRYMFSMNHEQFSEACHHVADAMTKLIPALSDAWKDHHGIK